MAYNGRSGTNKGRSSRSFNKRAQKTHRLNKAPTSMRGGIRL